MTPEVWQIEAVNGFESWTWGYVPASGSRYSSVGRGVWPTKMAAKAAMDAHADDAR